MENEMKVSDKQLKTVSELAMYQTLIDDRIKKVEEELATLKNQFKQVSQVDLPEALAETGLTEIKLTDGSKITVQQFYNASIPKDRMDEAFTWLRDNNTKILLRIQYHVILDVEKINKLRS